MDGLHSISPAFLFRNGVELGRRRERAATGRVGIVDERDVSVARATCKGEQRRDQEHNSHSCPTPRENGGPSRSSPTLCWHSARPSRVTQALGLGLTYHYLNSGSINGLVNPETGTTVRQNDTSQRSQRRVEAEENPMMPGEH
jgi:hypothetical protein